MLYNATNPGFRIQDFKLTAWQLTIRMKFWTSGQNYDFFGPKNNVNLCISSGHYNVRFNFPTILQLVTKF